MRVVLKVTKLENWLVADPQTLRDLPGLFEHVERIEKQVAPDRADAADATYAPEDLLAQTGL